MMIARSRALDRLRARRRWADWTATPGNTGVLLEKTAAVSAEIPDAHSERTERQAALAMALDGLPAEQRQDHWRDSHFRLEGPGVAQMQAAFLDNWIEATGEVPHGDAYFPELDPVGPHQAQMFKSSANEASVRIANAYFVPDALAVDTLVAARRRGVMVEIIVPGPHIDTAIVRKASRSRWEPLLEAGVAIYEYQPTMYHTKVMVVDQLWTSVGSTNFDNRSFRLNDEANLNVLDAAFAHEHVRLFETDKAQSRQLTLEWWRSRPWPERVTEWLAGLLRLQL